jgi:hypothetical protein
MYNTTVNKIKKNNSNYELLLNDNKIIRCEKLIIGTGLSKPVYPGMTLAPDIPNERKPNHYADFPCDYFVNNENLIKYNGKRLLIVGGGNAAYELANILQNHCSSIVMWGSQKKLSIVSHYVGDIRSIYYPFFDTFYLKSLIAIDVVDKQRLTELKVTYISDVKSEDYNKLMVVDQLGKPYYPTPNELQHFDEIIYCTGWSFDSSIYDFKINMKGFDKYPEIKDNYESVNNANLFFIGALMHSLDFKKGSGGFIHGFRYLIKLFTQINYNAPKSITKISFTGNMDCYKKLADHMFNRIRYTSSLYQLYGTMCDIFYYNKKEKTIYYVQDWKIQNLSNLNLEDHIEYVNALYLEYGPEETMINRLGSFNKWNPTFLHPKIHLYKHNKPNLTPLDRVTFDEDLLAAFNNDNTYNKLFRVIKMCNLVV